MRYLTAISITTLAVALAALVLVLLLFITEPWEPEAEQPATKVHTQELDEDMVYFLIYYHVKELKSSAGITMETHGEGLSDEDWEAIKALPGHYCFWEQAYSGTGQPSFSTNVRESTARTVTYNYVKEDDLWLITAIGFRCESDSGINTTTWAVDDNTGAITYGRPDVRDE